MSLNCGCEFATEHGKLVVKKRCDGHADLGDRAGPGPIDRR